MSNYIGVKCPICNKRFAEADDIVVCPVCGAPHHRECYAEKNQCAFIAEHLDGKEWSRPEDSATVGVGEAGGETGVRTCTGCGAKNPEESIFCQICGKPLTLQTRPEQTSGATQWEFPNYNMNSVSVDSISMLYGGLSPEDQVEGESAKDLAQYVGVNSSYYLPRFKAISESRGMFAPNFAALFFNFFYFFYRKMYLIGFALLAVYVVSSIPSYLYAQEVLPYMLYERGLGPFAEINQQAANHFLNLSSITRTISISIGLVMSFLANRLYYNKAVGDVRAIRAIAGEAMPQEEYFRRLRMRGGSNKGAVIAVAASLFFVQFAVSVMISYFIIFPAP